MGDEKPGSCSDEELGGSVRAVKLIGVPGGRGNGFWELRLTKQKVNELKGSCCWIPVGLAVCLEAAVLAFMYEPVFGQYR